MFKRLATLSAAALLAAVPVFAHDHGEEHGKMEADQCPHHQAVTTAVDQAIASLDAALTEKDPAAMTAKVTEARKQLAEAKSQMKECKEMCGKMMGHGAMMDHGAMMNHGGHDMAPADPAKDSKVNDPVCGMELDPTKAGAKSVYAGKSYYFCSQEDKEKFDKDPEMYLKKGM